MLLGSSLATFTSNALASDRVVVVAPKDRADAQLVHQIAGELRSAGFSVVIRTRTNAPDSRELEALAKETESFAALALWIPGDAVEAEVWVVDLVTGKTVLRRMEAQSASERPSIFAIRAVELLQASLLELETGRKPGGVIAPSLPIRRFARVTPQDQKPVERWPSSPRASWSLLAGMSVAGGPGGLPPGLAPTFGLAWRPMPRWSGQLWVFAPALTTIEAEEGSATLDQELLALRFAYVFTDPSNALSAYAVGGGGAYRLGARGAAESPYESRAVAVWSGAAVAGSGASLRLNEAFRLFVELDATLLFPRPEVRFADRTVALGGRPWLLGTLGADVRW